MASLAATNDGSAGAIFLSTVQATGVDVSRLGAIAQLQLAVANILGGGADLTSPLTLGANGAAFVVTGTTVPLTANAASGAITFNANIGTGTGAVGGFVFAVPVTGSTGSTAQTLTNALVIGEGATGNAPAVYVSGADAAKASILTGSTGLHAVLQIGVVRVGQPVLSMTRVNGTLAAPTIITTGQVLGVTRFQGAMSATVAYSAAEIRSTSTEGWVNATSGGANLTFLVTPNTTGALTTALTIDQDTSATFALSVKTGTPNGGTAGAWKFGIRVAATVSLDTTQYIQLDVGGTLYKLAVVS